jgi:hypothetical protein
LFSLVVLPACCERSRRQIARLGLTGARVPTPSHERRVRVRGWATRLYRFAVAACGSRSTNSRKASLAPLATHIRATENGCHASSPLLMRPLPNAPRIEVCTGAQNSRGIGFSRWRSRNSPAYMLVVVSTGFPLRGEESLRRTAALRAANSSACRCSEARRSVSPRYEAGIRNGGGVFGSGLDDLGDH